MAARYARIRRYVGYGMITLTWPSLSSTLPPRAILASMRLQHVGKPHIDHKRSGPQGETQTKLGKPVHKACRESIMPEVFPGIART